MTLINLANVPVSYKSSWLGESVSACFWQKMQNTVSGFCSSMFANSLLSALPIRIGVSTDGNTTRSRVQRVG